MSDETRSKKSQAMMGNQNSKGVVISAETKTKMSQAHKGKNLSEEHKDKLSQAHMGKTFTDLTKAKMSLSQQIRFARERGDLELVAQLQKEREALD